VKVIVTLIYKPFGIIAGILAGLFSKKLFNFIWARIDDEDPPKANTEQADVGKVLAAAAVQGMVFKTVRALVDRQAARGFYYVTGVWPGEKKPDPQP
jgi:hypothetical protein